MLLIASERKLDNENSQVIQLNNELKPVGTRKHRTGIKAIRHSAFRVQLRHMVFGLFLWCLER